MADMRSVAADSWTVAVALALVVGELPQTVRAGEPASLDGPVEPLRVTPATPDMPPELATPPVPTLGEARRLEADLRFAEAARVYEAHWQATADARFLYSAATAHARAGHHAIALRLLEQCLTTLRSSGHLPEPVRIFLEQARQREEGATWPVRLAVVEGQGGGLTEVPGPTMAAARTVLQQLGPSGQPVPGGSFELRGRPPGQLRLDPGPWLVQVEAPGLLPLALQVNVSEGSRQWQVVVHRRKVVVDLRFSPERALRGAHLKLQALDHASPFAVERPLFTPTATVMLTAGAWRLQVRARRHAADINLAIGTGMGPIDVALVPRKPVDDQRLMQDRKLLFGLLGSFVVTYATGIGLLIAAANLEKRAERRDAAAYKDADVDPAKPGEIDPAAAAAIEAAYPAERLHRDLAYAGSLHTAGTLVAGVSLGAMLSAVPMAIRARRRAAVIELGIGGALLAGAGGWMAFTLGERERLLRDPDQRVLPSQLDRGDGQRIASSLLAGVGLGLVVFSGIVLARDAADRRKRARAFTTAPWTAPGLAGWSLAGKF